MRSNSLHCARSLSPFHFKCPGRPCIEAALQPALSNRGGTVKNMINRDDDKQDDENEKDNSTRNAWKRPSAVIPDDGEIPRMGGVIQVTTELKNGETSCGAVQSEL